LVLGFRGLSPWSLTSVFLGLWTEHHGDRSVWHTGSRATTGRGGARLVPSHAPVTYFLLAPPSSVSPPSNLFEI
jgi:hypothetical protein